MKVPAPEHVLATARPEVAADWHPTRNGEMTPFDVTLGSGRKVWWRCFQGHEWQAVVNSRARGSRCPMCAGIVAVPGETDLGTIRPDLAAQWHPTRNSFKISTVLPQSNKSAWWLCESGHEWEAKIQNRFQGNGCPVCAGQMVVPGLNDMATVRPDLAAEFHPTKNAPLTPASIFPGVARKLWWRCDLGHEWEATGNSRSSLGTNCPACSGHRIVVGFNDLPTVAPEVAAEWHPTLNGEITPTMVTLRNGKKRWWRCELGHEWRTTTASRTAGNGCPTCAGRNVQIGVNDLASRRPAVALTWHPTRNGEVRPIDVTQFSNRSFWWQCLKGHEWRSTVNNRSHGQGCPQCAETGFQANKPGLVYFLEHRAFGAFKIGITNVGTSRLANFQREGWEILNLELFEDGHHARQVEAAIKHWWRVELGLPVWLAREDMAATSGWTETVEADALSHAGCVARIKAESVRARLGNG
ncbi:zinc-ribbon domain-containing protein [Microbacterium capsulatum]|uniref:Zinc-ribbon domain-containing protein n=1 Tax=Microbacterium capsulatum TaxID=3041921 RepID=A0ABU0XG24_9MICO|nr:zinc-ribbon domain-containing protein [Microbacterium sp. ASV81]MDQ4214079.1 zinc-ribbon domain-containing protein [Microbacterium sp. ASV81]